MVRFPVSNSIFFFLYLVRIQAMYSFQETIWTVMLASEPMVVCILFINQKKRSTSATNNKWKASVLKNIRDMKWRKLQPFDLKVLISSSNQEECIYSRLIDMKQPLSLKKTTIFLIFYIIIKKTASLFTLIIFVYY